MVHLYPDGGKLVYTAIAFVVLDTIAVVLRLLSKQQTKRRFGEDDGWILAALITFFAWSAVIIASRSAFPISKASLELPLQVSLGSAERTKQSRLVQHRAMPRHSSPRS